MIMCVQVDVVDIRLSRIHSLLLLCSVLYAPVFRKSSQSQLYTLRERTRSLKLDKQVTIDQEGGQRVLTAVEAKSMRDRKNMGGIKCGT